MRQSKRMLFLNPGISESLVLQDVITWIECMIQGRKSTLIEEVGCGIASRRSEEDEAYLTERTKDPQRHLHRL